VTGLAAGTYTVLAVAVDDDGATTSSNSVTVTVAPAPVSTSPADVVFTASTNHATAVTNYRLAVHAAGKVPGVDAPVSTLDLGKPAPAANGDIAVSCSAFFTALPKGSYVLTVLAMGPSGTARSAAVAFTR
jgi:chitinase